MTMMRRSLAKLRELHHQGGAALELKAAEESIMKFA